MFLSQYPRVMFEATSMFVHTHYITLRGPDTSSVAVLVFSFPLVLLKLSIESSFLILDCNPVP